MAAIDNLYGAVTSGTHPISALYATNPTPKAAAPKPVASVPSFTSVSAAAKPATANPFSAYPAAAAAYTAAKQKQAASGVSSFADPYAAEHAAVAAMSPADLSNFQKEFINHNTGGFAAFEEKWAPIIIAGIASGGIGAGVGGAVASAGYGGLAAGAAGGAAAGAAGTEINSLENNLTLAKPGQVVKGAVTGAVGGGIASQLGGVTHSLTSAGLPTPIAAGLVKGAAGAVTGAVGGAIGGQGAGKGAVGGALQGAVAGAGSAVAGSIFNSGNTVNTSNSTVIPPPTNNTMADYPVTTDGTDLNAPITFQDPSDPYSNPGYQNLDVQGGGTTLGGGYGNGSTPSSGASGSLLASLASKLFGGNVSPQNMGLLQQLLGAGVNGAAGLLNSQAAKGATQQYANQTKYNPYNISTAGGSTIFGANGGASSSLSAGNQANLSGLNNLSQQSLAGLKAGPQGAANQYYQQLQAQQKQGNDRFISNNSDNEFGKGILASTAGQYQTQGAVDSIHNQNLQDSVLANNFAQGQQQQQLNNLTAGLGGASNINAQQLQQIMYGGNLGSQASTANSHAYAPLAGANSNSPVGSILSSIGTQYNNSGQYQPPPGP